MTSTPDPAAPLSRQLRMIWGAMCAGIVLASVVMASLVATGADGGMADAAQPAFFGVAVLSLAGLAVALSVMRGLEDRETREPGYVQSRAIIAIAALEATGFLAAIAAFLTGDLLTLAFIVPMLGFAAVFWPSEARVARWLGV